MGAGTSGPDDTKALVLNIRLGTLLAVMLLAVVKVAMAVASMSPHCSTGGGHWACGAGP